MLNHKWTIRSCYIGKKKDFQGLSFGDAGLEFDSKEQAQSHADKLNGIKVDRYPGRDFEFRVVPIETAAVTPEE